MQKVVDRYAVVAYNYPKLNELENVMGDYSDVPVKMATKSAPAAAYGDKRQLVRDNMLAMDKRSNFYNPDQHSFNTMKMLMNAKKYNNRFRYNAARWSIIKLVSS